MAECVSFYTTVLEPFGYTLAVDGAQKGFAHNSQLDFWLVDGEPSAEVHYAFAAADRATVEIAFARSQGHGGRQDRAPALAAHIHPTYFAAYARDPDNRLVEFVCQSAPGANTQG